MSYAVWLRNLDWFHKKLPSVPRAVSIDQYYTITDFWLYAQVKKADVKNCTEKRSTGCSNLCAWIRCYARQHVTRHTVSRNFNQTLSVRKWVWLCKTKSIQGIMGWAWADYIVTISVTIALLHTIWGSSASYFSTCMPQQLTRGTKSLIWAKLLYCSQVWRPHRVKYSKNFECVHHWATKVILLDYQSNYKLCLIFFLFHRILGLHISSQMLTAPTWSLQHF